MLVSLDASPSYTLSPVITGKNSELTGTQGIDAKVDIKVGIILNDFQACLFWTSYLVWTWFLLLYFVLFYFWDKVSL